MLILPLKTSSRNSIKDDIAKWLDSNSNNDDHFGARDNYRATTSNAATATAAPPPSFDMVLQNQRPKLTSAQCYRELQRLQSVRNCIIDSILKSNSHPMAIKENALRDCYEYHAILLQFEQHGFSDSSITSTLTTEQPQLVTITWKGAYNSNESETHSTLVWDRVCIMYNIAALLSYQINHDYSMPKLSSTTTDRDKNRINIRQ